MAFISRGTDLCADVKQESSLIVLPMWYAVSCKAPVIEQCFPSRRFPCVLHHLTGPGGGAESSGSGFSLLSISLLSAPMLISLCLDDGTRNSVTNLVLGKASPRLKKTLSSSRKCFGSYSPLDSHVSGRIGFSNSIEMWEFLVGLC